MRGRTTAPALALLATLLVAHLQAVSGESVAARLAGEGVRARHAAAAARAPGADDKALPPLPSAQEIDALRKVAQILAMLGQQVIPSLVGPSSPPASQTAPAPAPAPPASALR